MNRKPQINWNLNVYEPVDRISVPFYIDAKFYAVDSISRNRKLTESSIPWKMSLAYIFSPRPQNVAHCFHFFPAFCKNGTNNLAWWEKIVSSRYLVGLFNLLFVFRFVFGCAFVSTQLIHRWNKTHSLNGWQIYEVFPWLFHSGIWNWLRMLRYISSRVVIGTM